MYGGRLESADEVCQHRLTDLTQVQETEETVSALCLVDTAGCDMGEEQDEAGSSFNQGEALVVREYLHRLLQAGITQEQIGVLTPYAAQVAALTRSSPILRPRLLFCVHV
jgi:superfamily I DNA and/or RNA helicase